MRASRKNRGWAAGIGLALTSAVAATAVAEAPANNGAMTFPHVRVVNVAQPTSSSAASAPAQVVSRDPSSGALRAATADEMRALNAPAKKALVAKRSVGVNTATEVAAADAGPSVSYGADGTITIDLTEEQMVHQVAHKQGDRLVVEETIGRKAAERATQAGAKQGVSNER